MQAVNCRINNTVNSTVFASSTRLAGQGVCQAEQLNCTAPETLPMRTRVNCRVMAAVSHLNSTTDACAMGTPIDRFVTSEPVSKLHADTWL